MKLILSSVALFLVLAFAPAAHAQTTHLDVDTQLRPIDRELDAINTESTAATVLYVTGTLVLVGGVGIAAGTAALAGSWVGGGGPTDNSQTIDAGVGIAAAGLLIVGIAIGLDVDSGHRRRAHATRLALAPTLGGGMLSVSGTF